MSRGGAWLTFGIGLLGWIVDYGTKELALTVLDPNSPPAILGGLVRFQLIRNPGAAFSLGESFTVGLTIIAILALIGSIYWVLSRKFAVVWSVCWGLLLAGILGNLTDRLFREPGPFRGHVVDFIQLPYFAVFNFADICITFAAVGVIYFSAIRKLNWDGERMS